MSTFFYELKYSPNRESEQEREGEYPRTIPELLTDKSIINQRDNIVVS